MASFARQPAAVAVGFEERGIGVHDRRELDVRAAFEPIEEAAHVTVLEPHDGQPQGGRLGLRRPGQQEDEGGVLHDPPHQVTFSSHHQSGRSGFRAGHT